MNVCIDVGNTTIGVGFFEEDKLLERLTFTVDLKKTKDEYVFAMKRAVKDYGLDPKRIEHIIFSSVVPSINEPLGVALYEAFGVKPTLIAPGIKTGLIIHVDNPSEIGNDLIGVLVGAKEKYGYPCVIADLGTASKVLFIDKDGAFTSCVILAGLSLSMEVLTKRAALLHEISLKRPKTVYARNTVDALNAGAIYGQADMIMGIAKRYEETVGYEAKHILTGGDARFVKDIVDDSWIYEPNLCVEGLNSILRRNEDK